MNRYLRVIFLVCIAHVALGQSHQNPFDLKYRAPKTRPSDTVKPAEVNRDTTHTLVPEKNSVNPPAVVQKEIPDTFTSIADKTIRDTSGQGSNPFETKTTDDKVEKDSEVVVQPSSEQSQAGKRPAAQITQSFRGFQIFFLLISILFLIFIVNVERSFIRDLWRVISNENYSSLHHRSQRNTMRQILRLMGYLIFILQAGLFIHLSLQIRQINVSALSSIWMTVGMVSGVYLIRHAVIRYLRWLFNNEKELSLFSFDISIFNTMVGLILLPLNIMLIFGPETLYNALIIIGVIAVGAAYLLRQIRWLFASSRLIANSLFLFFIYLCAVEILPLWTISKIFW